MSPRRQACGSSATIPTSTSPPPNGRSRPAPRARTGPRRPAHPRHATPGGGRLRRAAHAAPFNLTTFPNDEGYDELVLARDIPFHSLCQHHLLPFNGVAHVGYLPGDRILGLSKLARVVELFARGPPGAGAADQAGRRLAAGPARSPRASAWSSRPSTSACRCAASRPRVARTVTSAAARPAARGRPLPRRVLRPGRGARVHDHHRPRRSPSSAPASPAPRPPKPPARPASTAASCSSATNPTLPYERPPLSKAVLRGEQPPESARRPRRGLLRRTRHRAAHRPRSVALDLDARGARPRRRRADRRATRPSSPPAPPRDGSTLPGADLDGVHYLRTRRRRRSGCATPSGAGTRVAVDRCRLDRHRGRRLRPSDGRRGRARRPRPRPAPAGPRRRDRRGLRRPARRPRRHAAARHRRHALARHRRRSRRVVLSDGSVEAADLVVVGIGVTPRTELAEGAGLAVDNGIVVDAHLADRDAGRVRRRRRRQRLAPPLRAAPPGRALGQRPEPGRDRRAQRRRRRRGLRPAPLLLLRPVRPRHGVRRPRPARRRSRRPRRPGGPSSSSPSGTATASSPPP